MSNSISILNYQDDIHVKMFRIWFIVKLYGLNRNKTKILTIDKVHILDFILQNEDILHFFHADNFIDYNRVLYKSNLSYGENSNSKPTLIALDLLRNLGYIEIDTDFFCTCTCKEFNLNPSTMRNWLMKAEKLKPLVNKPISYINKKLSEANL